jgi:anti-sigma-K factor RskA
VTRHGPDHERWADASGAYVLGALEPAEAERYAEHLRDCPACEDEVRSLRSVAEALPASAPQVIPAPDLKARVMAEVEREAAVLAAASGAAADRPAPARRSWWRLSPPRVAVAGLALAAVIAVALVIGGRLASDQTRVVAVAVDPAQAAGARGELRVRDDGATLVLTGMPRPQSGRVYQVWVKRPGRDPEPTDTLFEPRTDGSATAAVTGSVEDAEAVLVTSEPDGGSTAPSRPPAITAALNS